MLKILPEALQKQTFSKELARGSKGGAGLCHHFYRLEPEADVGVAPGQEEVLESSG